MPKILIVVGCGNSCRGTLDVSYDYVMHESGPVPAEKRESITVFAGNRNDTLFVKTESVAAREVKEEIFQELTIYHFGGIAPKSK